MCISWQVTQVISLLTHISNKSLRKQTKIQRTREIRMATTSKDLVRQNVSTVSVCQNFKIIQTVQMLKSMSYTELVILVFIAAN